MIGKSATLLDIINKNIKEKTKIVQLPYEGVRILEVIEEADKDLKNLLEECRPKRYLIHHVRRSA